MLQVRQAPKSGRLTERPAHEAAAGRGGNMTDERERRVKVYHEVDGPGGGLAGEAVAVLGYGNLGRTAALNLRDSGVKVRIGNREDGYAELARQEGFEVVPFAVAASDDVVLVLLPDEVIPAVFAQDVAPALRLGSAIGFGSGYSLAFGLVRPPDNVDVLLVAPRMAGNTARRRYLAGEGFWGCVGVEADRSGHAQRRMLGLAEGLGILRAGAVEMSAAVEATLDLFVEQTMGAVLGLAMMVAFEIGREADIPAEALVMEMYMSGEMEPWTDGRLRRPHAHPRDGPGGDGGILPLGPRGHPKRRIRPSVPGRGQDRLPRARRGPGDDARQLPNHRRRGASAALGLPAAQARLGIDRSAREAR